MKQTGRRVRWAWGFAVVVGCVLTGCLSIDPVPARPLADGVEILRAMTGDDPGLSKPMAVFLNSRSKLDALRTPALSKLEPDFLNEAVVVVALGERPTGGYWVVIDGVRRVDDALVVQVRVNRPGDDEMTTQAMTHPFAAAVIPVQDRAMEVRVEAESLRGQPNR